MDDVKLKNQDEELSELVINGKSVDKQVTSQIDCKRGSPAMIDSSRILTNKADGNCKKEQVDGNPNMKESHSHRNTILEEIEKLTLKHVMGCKKQSRPMSILQQKWNQMFDRLFLFKEKHGHCLVPNRYENDPALGAWVSTQRRQYKILLSGSSESTPMTAERASRLESLGFVWATNDPRHVPWEVRYKELCQYKEKYGDCLVPIGFKKNVKLANWVSTQRQEYKLLREGRSSRLTEDRIRLLQDIDFVWEAQRGGPRKRKLYLDSDLTKKLQEYPKGKKRNLTPTNYESSKPLNIKSSIVNTIDAIGRESQKNNTSNRTSPAVNVFFQILPQAQNESPLLTKSLSFESSENKLSNSNVLRNVPNAESTIIQLKVFSSGQKPATTSSSVVPAAEIVLPTSSNNISLGLVSKSPQNMAIASSDHPENPSVAESGNLNPSEKSEMDFNVFSNQARSAMYSSLNGSEIAAATTLFQIEPLMRREKASMLSTETHNLNVTSSEKSKSKPIISAHPSLDKTAEFTKRKVSTQVRSENTENSSPAYLLCANQQVEVHHQNEVDQPGIFDDAEEDADIFSIISNRS